MNFIIIPLTILTLSISISSRIIELFGFDFKGFQTWRFTASNSFTFISLSFLRVSSSSPSGYSEELEVSTSTSSLSCFDPLLEDEEILMISSSSSSSCSSLSSSLLLISSSASASRRSDN